VSFVRVWLSAVCVGLVCLFVAVVPASAEVPAGMPVAAAERVELLERRTETSRVFANPSGTVTLEQHNQPIHVRRGEGWVPVDDTLEVRGGRLVPRASPLAVSFSAGGDVPLATWTSGAASLSLSWPTSLPAPTLVGDTAEYREVLPGVDLRAQADVAGARLLVVVKNREAAELPEIRRVAYRVVATGVTVRTDPGSGALSVVDAAGAVVFSSGTPIMWDSADRLVTVAAGGASGEEPARRQVTVPVQIGPDEVALVPDRTLLTGADTVYPVVVDPWFSAPWVSWTHVDSGFSTVNYLNDPNRPDIPVGAYVHAPTGATHNSVSYYGFDVSALRGLDIISATMRAFQIHNAPAACVLTPVQLVWTAWFDHTTTWNNPPTSYGLLQSGSSMFKSGHGGCPANWVEFNAATAVDHAADHNWTHVALALQSPDWNTVNRKRFSKAAALVVEFNSPPGAPHSTYADINLPCVIGPDRPTANTPPTLTAFADDPDGGSVAVQFDLWPTGGTGSIWSYTHPYQPVKTRFAAEVPAQLMSHGQNYSWRARTTDGRAWSDWTSWCEFSYDTVRPAAAPGVEELSAFVRGAPGEFRFTSTDPDVYGYQYGLIQSTTYFVEAGTGPDRAATVPFTPWRSGPQFLYVRSVDRAGNPSEDAVPFEFLVSSATPAVPHERSDIDGDGRADLTSWWQRDSDESALLTFTSTPNGLREPVRTWDPGADPAFATARVQTAAGDFNGDGRGDVAVLRDDGGLSVTVYLLRGNGMGFDAPVQVWTSGPGNWDLASGRTYAGDINADGRADLLNFHGYGGAQSKVIAFYGTAVPSSGAVGETDPSLTIPTYVWDSGVGNWNWASSRETVGDFDGDGRADIAAFYDYGAGQSKYWVLFAGVSGLTTPTMVFDGLGYWQPWRTKEIAGDFDGDGRTDLGVFADESGGRTHLWIFRGTVGALAYPFLAWDSGPASWTWTSIKATTGDVNTDGRDDVMALYNHWSVRTEVFVFNGTASGVANPVQRWDSGNWGLDWLRLTAL
jgi:hypothetical protein